MHEKGLVGKQVALSLLNEAQFAAGVQFSVRKEAQHGTAVLDEEPEEKRDPEEFNYL